MEKPHPKPSLKFVKTGSQSTTSSWSSSSGGMKDELKEKSKSSQKSPKTQEIKLHTEQRASKRAMFDYMVAAKLNILKQQRRQEEMMQKMIEEEEIRLLRKEMVPRAQLMPFFDKPFIPQRSSRPLTVPKEPSCFRMISSKGYTCNSSSELYNFQQPTQAMNPIQ